MIDFVWRDGYLWWGRFEAGRVIEANPRSFWPEVAGCLVRGNMGCADRVTAEKLVEDQARFYIVALIAAPGVGTVIRE